MKNRIWNAGEGLSWSTIADLLGQDEDTPKKLQELTLDLTDDFFEKLKKYKELVKQLDSLKSDINFIKGNLGSCIQFGQKRLGYEPCLKYVHDNEAKIVKITVANGEIGVNEEYLTV